MAYQNFIPEIWESEIQRELERDHVFAADCNTRYEGKVKKMGDSVRILGVGKPTITTVGAKSFSGLNDPETVEDTSVIMYIDQMSHFNFKIGDIDEHEAVDGVMEALRKEAAEGLADKQDLFIAELVKGAKKCNSSVTQVTSSNVLDQIDLALEKLYENDVKKATTIVIDMSPAVWTVFKKAYIALDQDNSDLLANGAVAKYAGAYIKLSNNVYKTTESGHTVYNMMVRTQRAVAFACPVVHVEPYRIEKDFADGVKGFCLYGGKLVRPKEIVNLNLYV